MRPPDRATIPFESERPMSFMLLILMPCARLIAGLEPVARMAEPCSVPKYQYSAAMITIAKIAPLTIAEGMFLRVMRRSYASGFAGLFADMPMMRRLTEYSANCVSIPARMAGMPNFVCRRPVQRPANIPAMTAMMSATYAG